MHLRHGPLIGLSALMLSCLTLRANDILTVDDINNLATPADYRISYGDGALQFGEIRLPEGEGPYPVAIVIHGGCWLSQYDIAHIGSLASALTELGIATWSLEYRRVGDAQAAWPATFEDVARGADHLRALAADYHLDLDRVIAIGHSAGGHLALWLAGRSGIADTSEIYTSDPIGILGVLALAPAPDLAYLHAQKVCDHVIDRLMGGSPAALPERYAAASPPEMVPLRTRQIILTGAHDARWLPVGMRYVEAARKAGDDVEHVMAPDSGHFEVISPTTSTWELVRAATVSLLHLDRVSKKRTHVSKDFLQRTREYVEREQQRPESRLFR